MLRNIISVVHCSSVSFDVFIININIGLKTKLTVHGRRRFPHMKKMMEHYIDFPTLNDEARVVLILTAACQSPAIMKKIYTMWTDRFCSRSCFLPTYSFCLSISASLDNIS